MPYITQDAREDLRSRTPQTAGELTYQITVDLMALDPVTMRQYEIENVMLNRANEYIRENGISYQHISDVIGSLMCVGLEWNRRQTSGIAGKRIKWVSKHVANIFYRQTVAPYEDLKIEENGDLF